MIEELSNALGAHLISAEMSWSRVHDFNNSINALENLKKGIKQDEKEMMKCIHETDEIETIAIGGTDETITICHDCGCEL